LTSLRAALLGMLCAPAALCCPAPARAQEGGATTLYVQTVPVLEGVGFVVGGRTFTTDARGRALVLGPAPGLAERIEIPDMEIEPGVRARFSRRKEGKYLFDLLYRVRMSFRDLAGRPIDASRVTSITLKGSHGVRKTLKPGRAQWLQGARVVPFSGGYRRKRLTWVVEKAIVDGTNVVNRGQQSFLPAGTRNVRVELLFYPAHVSARDALFKFPLGSHVRIEYPNGRVERHALDQDAEVTLPSLARGEYRVSVEAPGISFERPLSLSREQTVELEVLSYLDLGLSFGVLISVALGLLLVGRPHLARAPRRLSSHLSHAVEQRVGIARRRLGRSRPRAQPPKNTRSRRRDRLGGPPTWRDSTWHAAIAALVVGLLVVLLFGRDPSVGALLAVFMFLLYLPLSYGTNRALHDSRSGVPEKTEQMGGRQREDGLRTPPSRRDR
jgi:hypothetical protein